MCSRFLQAARAFETCVFIALLVGTPRSLRLGVTWVSLYLGEAVVCLMWQVDLKRNECMCESWGQADAGGFGHTLVPRAV